MMNETAEILNLCKRLLVEGWKWSGSDGISIFLALSTRDVEMAGGDDRYIHMAMKRMGDFQCDNLGGCTPSSCTW